MLKPGMVIGTTDTEDKRSRLYKRQRTKSKTWRSVPNNLMVPSALTSGTDEETLRNKQGKVEA